MNCPDQVEARTVEASSSSSVACSSGRMVGRTEAVVATPGPGRDCRAGKKPAGRTENLCSVHRHTVV